MTPSRPLLKTELSKYASSSPTCWAYTSDDRPPVDLALVPSSSLSVAEVGNSVRSFLFTGEYSVPSDGLLLTC